MNRKRTEFTNLDSDYTLNLAFNETPALNAQPKNIPAVDLIVSQLPDLPPTDSDNDAVIEEEAQAYASQSINPGRKKRRSTLKQTKTYKPNKA